MRRRDLADLAPILLVALIARLWGFRWGVPGAAGDMTAIHEAWKFWRWGMPGGPDLNPHDFGWPSFIFYLAFLEQALALAWGRVTGTWPTTADFRLMFELDPAPLILVGRAFSTAADLGVVALTWYLARSLFGRGPAILAALIVALDRHHVAWSQNVGPEVWVALFVLLGTLELLRIAGRGLARDYLLFGLFTGLGVAAKYTPVLLFAALPLAHRLAPARRAKDLALAGGAAFLAFFAASPFVILDPRESVFYLFSQSRRLAAVPHFGQESLGPGWLFYLRNSLPESLGWVWLALGIAGLAWILRRPFRREALPFIFPVIYFAIFAAATSKYDHYMLPVTPFLAMAGAAFLAVQAARVRGIRPAAIAGALAVIAFVVPVAGIARRHAEIERPDSRRVARDWIERHLPAGALVVSEFDGPDLVTTARIAAIQHDPGLRDVAPRLLERLAAHPAYAVEMIPLFAQEPEESAPFYDLALYDGFQYCITSSEVASRYRADPGRFRAQTDFYRTLDALGAPLQTFGGGGAAGPEIRIYPIRDATSRLAAAAGADPGLVVDRAFDGVRRYARERAERAAEFATRLGHALEEGGDLPRAARAWSLALEFTPRDTELHHALGEIFGRLGREDLAGREYQQVLALDPDHVGALNNLGGLELRQGHVAEARRLFERALAIQPDFADAHANLGWILWIQDHDLAGARHHFEEALRLAPSHPGAPRLRMAIEAIARGERSPPGRPQP